ncbi:hypothetical protein [Pseudogemmobacter faecipullorum]|uniref:Phage gp6-like head-tail connector protein n=1 Tax=Pseudogemmobacter faecipullorum TaxID=2755041 RepID=A0ABS8CS77_9RHOB|nr:hypothetical protein [Pseudogemmobacter faecipullorum]MCB5412254.1 hypothetical protein [Pseudogemmobacter faecipullorum]
MVPIRVTPPDAPLVSLEDLKKYLRVDFDDDDDEIKGHERVAVAHLDGWRGILGRCIQLQSWSISFPRPGCHRLPLPDVQSVAVDAGTAVLHRDALGSHVTLTEPATVTMSIEAPGEVREIARALVMMLVKRWYDPPRLIPAPDPISSLIDQVRWGNL